MYENVLNPAWSLNHCCLSFLRLWSWTRHDSAPGKEEHADMYGTVPFIFLSLLPLISVSRLLGASSDAVFCPCPSDKRGAVSDHQPGDGADWLASRGHQVSPQWTFPGCTGERQFAHVTTRSVYVQSYERTIQSYHSLTLQFQIQVTKRIPCAGIIWIFNSIFQGWKSWLHDNKRTCI